MIYKARFVLPITSEPIDNGEVLVHGAEIKAVGRNLVADYPDEPVKDLGNAVLMPGFINTHTHLDYTVMRGLIDDASFFPWVQKLIQYGAQFQRDDFLASARLGALQMVRAGVTTIVDASYSGAVVDAAKEAGLRGLICQETFGADVPEGYAEEIIGRIESLQATAGDRITVGVSPHSPYTSSETRLEAVAKLAQKNDLWIIIHIAETTEELQCIKDGTGPAADFGGQIGVKFRATGKTPVEYLHDLGILGNRTLAAHCVHVNESDIQILAEIGTGVAHCPKSNAKLGNGIAPFPEMISAGVRTGIGTDSAASGDPLDMNDEMRFAVLLQRAASEDAYIMDSRRVVEAATIGGAKSIGLEGVIGSLETGKRADMVAVDISKSAFPASNPYSALVYSCSSTDVVLTIVDGDILYDSGQFSRVDEQEVRDLAGISVQKLHIEAPNHYVDKFFGTKG